MTIHYYSIVYGNWELLGNYFTKPGEEQIKKSEKLNWLNKFNTIRQKYSHPQREKVTETELEELEKIHEFLKGSLILSD